MSDFSNGKLDFLPDYPKNSRIKWKYGLSFVVASYAFGVALAGGYLNFRGGIFGEVGMRLLKYPIFLVITIPFSWVAYFLFRTFVFVLGVVILEFENWLHQKA